MEPIRISLLGISGSGKTSFLAGLNVAFRTSLVGEQDVIASLVRTFGDDNISITDIFKVMNHPNENTIEGAMGASGTRVRNNINYVFGINFDDLKKIPTNVIDYEGGWISGVDVPPDDADIVMDFLLDSNVIFIIMDGIILANEQENLIEKKTGALNINLILNRLMMDKDKKRDVSVVTVLTKTDSICIDSKYKENNFEKLCDKAKQILGVYSPAVINRMKREYGWDFSMIPVTLVGENNSVTKKDNNGNYFSFIKEGAIPKQKNIDIAYLYGVKNSLDKKCVSYKKEIEELAISLRKFNNKKGLFSFIGKDKNANQEEANNSSQRLNKIEKDLMICEYIAEQIELGFGEQIRSQMRVY